MTQQKSGCVIAVDHSGSMIQHAQDCTQLVEKLIASYPDAVVVAFNAGKAYKLMPFDGILEENIGGGTPEVPVLTRLLADVFEMHEDEIIQAPVYIVSDDTVPFFSQDELPEKWVSYSCSSEE